MHGSSGPGRQRASRWLHLMRVFVLLAALLAVGLGCNLPALTATPVTTGNTPVVTLTLGLPMLSTLPQFTLEPLPTFNGNPPAGRIVFSCSIDSFDQVCIMDADGSHMSRLTTAAATEYYASIAPDATEIVFSSRRHGSFQIYGIDMDGSHLRRISDGKGSLFAPEVSPDGALIVFTYETGGTQNIWVMGRDGTNPHSLTGTGGDNGDPTWSPDGTRIAFASARSGSRQTWVMNSDGSNPRQVTDLPDVGGRTSWSVDGKRLAFYAGVTGDHNIFTIGVDGQDLRQLTSGGDNLGPSFSPDGQWIAFTSYRDLNNEIYIMHADGSQQTRLTFDPRADWQPRWGR